MTSSDLVMLIETLSQAFGPAGREDAVRDLVAQSVRERVDEVEVSPLGSLHARLGHRGARRLMLSAHLDEIGLIVSHIDERGFARFHSLGPIDLDACVGRRVRFADGTTAVVAVDPRKDRTKSPTREQLFLDFGVASREDCPVSVGASGVFDGPFLRLGKRVVSKAFDNRVGVAVLIETLRLLDYTPHQVDFVFTVQEEFASAGARTSAFALEPEVALVIDVSETSDTPRARSSSIRLGGGPMVKVRHGGMVSDARLVDLLVRRAAAANIPHQFEVVEGETSDADEIQRSRAGVLTAGISIPCRYVHTPSEMVDLGDVELTISLLLEVLRQPLDLGSP